MHTLSQSLPTGVDHGSGSYAQVIAGMDWVTERAEKIEVANMSLGGGYSQSVNNALAGMTSDTALVTYTPNADYNGSDAFTYWVRGPKSPAELAESSEMDEFD